MTDIEKELLKSKEKIEVPATDGLTVLNNIKQNVELNIVEKRRIRRPLILALAGSMAVIIALVTLIIGLNVNNSNNKLIDGKYKIVNADYNANTGVTQDTYIIKHWNEKNLMEKYRSISYGDMIYTIDSTLRIAPTDAKYIGTSLGSGEARGYDYYDQKQYTEAVEVYQILKIDTKIAIAVKFASEDNYYSYCNFNYNFNNIGEFVTKLNLFEYASFGSIYYNYKASDGTYYNVEFDGVDNNAILNAFFKNNEESIYGDTGFEYSKKLYSMQFNIPALGRINLSLSIDINHIATTNIFSYGWHFNVGDNALNFLDYLTNNYEGYIIYYNEPTTTNNVGDVTVSNPSGTRTVYE